MSGNLFRWLLQSAIVVLLSAGNGAAEEPQSAMRTEILKAVESRRSSVWQTAQKIWLAAEPGYQELQSSSLLADLLESAGLKVTRGIAGMPTAFTAEIGSGTPVIGILGEYDALPGLSQTADPEQRPRADGNGYGHGCGHHLFGTASASAAMAVADQIRSGRLSGTVRYYGCPAEEG
ncbi:MAG: hypothetical protein KDA89_24715, partial [Planctomycetaceae bacterium]|nr:hypothetical protein [Planctomycetaceae bacterium]